CVKLCPICGDEGKSHHFQRCLTAEPTAKMPRDKHIQAFCCAYRRIGFERSRVMSTFRTALALLALAVFTTPLHAALLTGNVTPPPANVNLTTEGNTDWIHWGLNSAGDVNRKITGLSQISNFTKIGSGT